MISFWKNINNLYISYAILCYNKNLISESILYETIFYKIFFANICGMELKIEIVISRIYRTILYNEILYILYYMYACIVIYYIYY